MMLSTKRSILLRATIGMGLVLAAVGAVVAGFSLEVRVDNVLIDIITDNGLGDDNDDEGDILYHFELSDVANRWEAEGDVIANGGFNGEGPVSTIVTNTVIEKIANVPIFTGEIDFIHNYAASGLQIHTAEIDGQFDNSVDHEVGRTRLEYIPTVSGQGMGAYDSGFFVGTGPEPFGATLGPLLLATTDEHHIYMRFYLDTLGDKIEMFNSAELHTVSVASPEPSSFALALLGLLSLSMMRRRRRR